MDAKYLISVDYQRNPGTESDSLWQKIRAGFHVVTDGYVVTIIDSSTGEEIAKKDDIETHVESKGDRDIYHVKYFPVLKSLLKEICE